MLPAVPGLGEKDGGDAVSGQVVAGLQAVFHEVADAVVLEIVNLGVRVAGGEDPDGLGRDLLQGAVQPGLDGPCPVTGGDEQKRRFLSQAGQDRHRVGEGLHRQFMGPVDELPDQGVDDPGLQVQALFQKKGSDVLVTQMPPAVALPGHLQEGGHDVRHHPVDIEGQAVQVDKV